MKRLTQRDEFGNTDIIGVDSGDLQLNLSFEELNCVTDALNRLAYFEDLQEQGRLYVAPCADGTEIWCVVSEDAIFFDDSIDYDNGCQIQSITYLHGHTEYAYGQFEKDWFLSQEAAEAAMKKMI